MADIKILIAAHKPYWMPTDDIYFPIHVGKYGKQDIGFVGDDSGENISSKNPNYCELTGVYWAWKNLNADYIGLAHYRRHFTMRKTGGSPETKKKHVLNREQLEPLLKDADIIVPNRRNYYIESNYSHYIHAHHQEGLDKVCTIIKKRYPAYTDACERVMNRSWAHMFNMFVMKKTYFDQYCAWLFAYYDRLFHLEKQFILLTPEDRLKERERQSKPVVEAFYAWVGSLRELPKTLVGKAIHYAQSQRMYLVRYLLDGRMEISNNRAENVIRPFVMGRKNWLFSNTPNGAKASSIYYSLIVSARENGLVPFEYLTKIFTEAPDGADVESLMPWNA